MPRTISHYIYEISGRKVGCCKNLEDRMDLYEEVDGTRPKYSIVEVLYDTIDQEAGDREWYWADKLGYPRDHLHYAKSISAMQERGRRGGAIAGPLSMAEKSPEERAKWIAKGLARHREITTSVQRSEWSKHRLVTMTPEERSDAARAGGLVGGHRTAELNLAGCQQKGSCRYCGAVMSLAHLGRWHNNNCPHKPKNRFKRQN